MLHVLSISKCHIRYSYYILHKQYSLWSCHLVFVSHILFTYSSRIVSHELGRSVLRRAAIDVKHLELCGPVYLSSLPADPPCISQVLPADPPCISQVLPADPTCISQVLPADPTCISQVLPAYSPVYLSSFARKPPVYLSIFARWPHPIKRIFLQRLQ